MKLPVYGHRSDDKTVVRTELSVDEIVRRGVHPFRVDLFDSRPVVLEVGGEPLNFHRLENITFAYKDENAETVRIIMHDGKQAVEIFGSLGTRIDLSLQVNHIDVLDDKELKDRFANWLALSAEGSARALPKISPRQVRIENGRTVYAVSQFDERHPHDAVFCGTMYEPMPVDVQLPDHIAWIWDAFGDWNPVVYGPQLLRALTGDRGRDDYVRFIVDRGESDISDRLNALADAPIGMLPFKYVFDPEDHGDDILRTASFRRHGREYSLQLWQNYPWRRGGKNPPLCWPSWLCSVEQVVAISPTKILASRIALFDIAKGQMRNLTTKHADASERALRIEHPEFSFVNSMLAVEK